jgi:CheY-like chemotaxis protein
VPSATQPVLVVDPDPAWQALARSALEPAGFRVLCAADGESALRLFHQVAPRAVVVDLDLSGRADGFELLERLRRASGGRDTHVIVWSVGEPSADDRRRLSELAQAFTIKGDEGTSLLDELYRLVPLRPGQPREPHA